MYEGPNLIKKGTFWQTSLSFYHSPIQSSRNLGNKHSRTTSLFLKGTCLSPLEFEPPIGRTSKTFLAKLLSFLLQEKASVEPMSCSFCKNIVTDVNERGCSGNEVSNIGLEHKELLTRHQTNEQLMLLEDTRALFTDPQVSVRPRMDSDYIR